jgi:hypothetical protein
MLDAESGDVAAVLTSELEQEGHLAGINVAVEFGEATTEALRRDLASVLSNAEAAREDGFITAEQYIGFGKHVLYLGQGIANSRKRKREPMFGRKIKRKRRDTEKLVRHG